MDYSAERIKADLQFVKPGGSWIPSVIGETAKPSTTHTGADFPSCQHHWREQKQQHSLTNSVPGGLSKAPRGHKEAKTPPPHPVQLGSRTHGDAVTAERGRWAERGQLGRRARGDGGQMTEPERRTGRAMVRAAPQLRRRAVGPPGAQWQGPRPVGAATAVWHGSVCGSCVGALRLIEEQKQTVRGGKGYFCLHSTFLCHQERKYFR